MRRRSTSLQDLLLLLLKEGRQRILVLAAIFTVVALGTLVAGLYWPQKYAASAAILVEPKSSIAPGTEGPPLSTLVNQIVLSRKILRELMTYGGWVEPHDPRAKDRLLDQIKSRISIATAGGGGDRIGPSLVRITYVDSDPERTFKIAGKLTEIYVRESIIPEERANRQTFEFIDGQVKEYAKKLADAHAQVVTYYQAHSATPNKPTPKEPPPKPGSISAADLAALRVEEANLQRELNRKRDPVAPDLVQAESHYRERALQLQGELERLLTTYTDEHPDVIRVKRELAQAKANADQARAERVAAETTSAAFEDDVMRAARQRLDDVQKKIAAATGNGRTPAPTLPDPSPATSPQDPEFRLVKQDAAMSELIRGYETDRDVYLDLLKRREQARVSLELAEQRGLRLQIQEPPEMPAAPVSARLTNIVLAGMMIAVLLPLALLFAIIKFDARVRSVEQLQSIGKLPVLVKIAYAPTPVEERNQRLRLMLASAMVAAVFIVYAAVFYIRYTTPS